MEEKTHEQPHPQAHDSVVHPAKQKLQLSKRTLILLAALVVAIGLVAVSAAYLLGKNQNTNLAKSTSAPTATPTSAITWKMYTNIKYNYTIEYPGDWSVREYADSKEGAAFNPQAKPGYPNASDSIAIAAGQKLGNYADLALAEYSKIAGKEIQNYNSLASLKKVTTAGGAVGYETTWMIQPITVMGRPSAQGESESLPITYFEIPGNKTSLVRVTLNRKEDLATYEKMLTTVKVMAPLTPIPTVDEAAVLKAVIKKYIILKRGGDENALTITVSKIEGNYAQGGASAQGGGGMWFAAKQDGTWRLVWDGNGTIDCASFSLYPNFPTSMVPECYDPATQSMVKR